MSNWHKVLLVYVVVIGLLCAQDCGTTVFPLLRVGFGARPAALGETFAGMVNDGASLWWNPGSMGFMDHSEVFATYHHWFQEFKDQYIGITRATRRGIFGFGFTNSGVTEIDLWDTDNYPVAGSGSQNAWILQLAYSKKVHHKLSLGTGYKFLKERIIDQSGYGYAFDFGANYLAATKANFGAVLRNIGPAMKYENTGYPLPTEFRLGGVFGPFRQNRLFIDFSLLKPGLLVHIGNEFWIKDLLALRIGYKAAHQENKWTYGLGIKYKKFHFDYAFAQYGILGATHRIWLSKEWGVLTPLGGLIVKVVDKETQKPLVAKLDLGKPISRKVTTDSISGSYKIKEVPVGEANIKVAKEKYYPKEDTTRVEPDRINLKIIELARIPPGTIAGKVVDVKTQRPVPAKIYYKGVFEGETYLDTIIGIYTIPRLEAGEYHLSIKPELPGYIAQEDVVVVVPGEVLAKDFELVKKGEVIVLRGVNFETGKATLLAESFPILDQAGKILKENPKLKVEIGGHTDNVPIHTPEFPSNTKLSQSRAEAVMKYLVEKFELSPERLVAKGYGDTQAMVSNKTAEGRAKNRRVEFKVLGE